MTKTVLITGASSGFGNLTAKKFQREGWNVVATMRNPSKETELNTLDNVMVSALDVTDKASIAESVATGISRFGRIDALVNNAGFALQGVMETTTDEQMRHQFDVNVFGMANVIQALLPHFRGNGAGVIINVSSIGGRTAFPYTTFYHASKFAVEGFTASLQYELNPLGIRLKLIEPGAYATNINDAAVWSAVDDDSVYKEKLEIAQAAMRAMAGAGAQDPQEVADAIYLAATDGSEQLRYPVGADAAQILGAREQMSDVEFKKMIAQSMGI